MLRFRPGAWALALFAAVPVAASPGGDHLVPVSGIRGALFEAAAARDRDLSKLQGLLATPVAVETARRMGVTEAQVSAGVAALGDADLHDLAQRAASLQTDPVAGQTYAPDFSGLGTALVVAGVLLLLIIGLVVWGLASLS
jgi:hypothetical protein